MPARTPAGGGKGRKRTAGSAPDAAVNAELRTIVEKMRGLPVVLFGDLVLDEFQYGEIARVSREAPVLILDYKESRYVPGGGANAAANLAALGARVRPVGRVGRDEAGDALLGLFEERRIETSFIVRDRGYRTPVKTRILAGSAHTSKQQIVRMDRGPAGQPLGRDAAARLLARLARASRGASATLVADYHFGAASPALLRAARPLATPVALDSRFRVLEYRRITAATPNVAEVEAALGLRIPDDDVAALEAAGASLRRTLGARAVVVTRGSRGMSLFEKGRRPVHLPAFGSDEVADVTGAGDTVISAFTLALAAGATYLEATRLANMAGGIVVMKRGTATVTPAEIHRAIEGEIPRRDP